MATERKPKGCVGDVVQAIIDGLSVQDALTIVSDEAHVEFDALKSAFYRSADERAVLSSSQLLAKPVHENAKLNREEQEKFLVLTRLFASWICHGAAFKR